MAAKILGLAKLQRKLNKLPDVAKKQIRAAMEKSADEMVSMMKSLVPVDSGDLKRSIGWTWGKAPKGSISVAAVTAANLGADLTLTIYAGDDKAFYARWVEFGVVAQRAGHKVTNASGRVRTSGRTTKGASAQPFFYVSYRANRKRAKSRISRAINKSAKQVAAGQ